MSDVRANLRRIAAVARRDLAIERSYSFRFLLRTGGSIVGILITYQTGLLVTDAPALAEWRGSYFDFVMVGLAVMSIAELGISAFNRAVGVEMSSGTLEVLLATPTPPWTLLSGALLFPSVLTVIELLWLLGFGLGVLGGGTTLTGLLLSLPVLALTLASFGAIGIIGAAFVVVTKRGDPLTLMIALATSVLAGAVVPVETFPEPLPTLARAFPAYYGIRGTRIALLTDASIADVAPYIGALALFDLAFLALAIWVWRRAIDIARRAGTLGSY